MKLFSLPYDLLTEKSDCQQQGLYVFEDDHHQFVTSNGYTLYNIGTLVYKNTWRKKGLGLIIDDLDNGKSIQEIMSDARGQFCLIMHTTENTYVITDKLGSFPVYVFEDENTVQISNIVSPLAKSNRVSANYQAFVEYLSFNYCFDCTFFNEIERLTMGTIYQFGVERKTQVYSNMFEGICFNKYADLCEVAGIAKKTLSQNLSFLNSNDKIFMDITGGFDTRTVATILRGMDMCFEAGTCGEQVLRESELARRVAEALGTKFHSYINISDVLAFRHVLDRHFLIGTGVPIFYHSTELINYYERIRQGFDIHITGFGGTELTTQDLPRLDIFSSKVNMKRLLRRLFGYKDIFVDSFYSKGQYYGCLARKIDTLLQKVGDRRHGEVANFLRLSIFNRYYHGCLIGTHNVLMPFYSPFLEADYIQLMMETPYHLKDYHKIQRSILTEIHPAVSSVMTSHGYNADINNSLANSMFYRCKNGVRKVSKQMVDQFGLTRSLKSSVRRIKEPITIEEIQRSFWVNEVNDKWSDDMEVLELVDRKKLSGFLATGQEVQMLKASLLYLNKIIEEYKIRL